MRAVAPEFHVQKKAGHPTWEEALVGPSFGPRDIGKTAPPPNSFEAAVKFTHGGKTRYYAEGMGTLGAGKGIFLDAQSTLTGTFHMLLSAEWIGGLDAAGKPIEPYAVIRSIAANF